VYKIGDIPEYVYLLIDGKVKMNKNSIFGNSKEIEKKNNGNDTIVIHQNAIFGDKDILFENRVKNATVVSANVQLLVIEKK
jgi:CRP-like cAMP-binding protein